MDTRPVKGQYTKTTFSKSTMGRMYINDLLYKESNARVSFKDF